MNLIYTKTLKPVLVGDKVSGHRLEKYYAHITKIHQDSVELLYNGDVRDYKVGFNVIGAILL